MFVRIVTELDEGSDEGGQGVVLRQGLFLLGGREGRCWEFWWSQTLRGAYGQDTGRFWVLRVTVSLSLMSGD